tara:strand:- start:340 stop:663 length:324 start_codon:yes stop_codon:yes gene_type:complete
MELNTSRVKDLTIGDLVTHVLYGKEWVGMILGFKEQEGKLQSRSEKALVQMQPGTLFGNFFESKVAAENRINDSLGYVTTNWLFKIEVKDANIGPSRNTTRAGKRED